MPTRRKMTERKSPAQDVQNSPEAQEFLKTGEITQDSPHYEMIPLKQLKPWKGQPRTYFDQNAHDALVKTLKTEGFKYPLLVRPTKNGYEVIAGERRLRASQEAKLETVPCLIQEMDDEQALISSLSENLLREDLNPIEVVNSLLNLLTQTLNLKEDDLITMLYKMKYKHEKKEKDVDILFPKDSPQAQIISLLEQFGYDWYSFVCNQLKLKKLPSDIYDAISSGKIQYTKGLLFKSIKDEEIRKTLLEQAHEKNWTQKEIREEIKKVKNQSKEGTDSTPEQQLSSLNQRLKKMKPWKTNPSQWKKIKTKLEGVDKLLQELEETEEEG